MKRIIALALVSIFLFSVASPASWTDRFREWLPDFIAQWIWSDDEDDKSSISTLTVSEAMAAMPAVATSPFQLQWPFVSLDRDRSLERWQRAEQASVLVRNAMDALPLNRGSSLRLLFPSADFPVHFAGLLGAYGPLKTIGIDPEVAATDWTVGADPGVSTVIFSDPETAQKEWFRQATNLPPDARVILVHFGDLSALGKLPENWSLLYHPERNAESESYLAQAIFGGAEVSGRLREGTEVYSLGEGEDLPVKQMGYSAPENQGFDANKLEMVDREINYAIRKRATPGAQLLVAKGGKVVYQKSYGHHTYQRRQEVYSSDLYDLASVTKAAATSLAVMKLYEEGILSLEQKVKDWLPELARRPAGRYTIERLLTHQTGLQADLPIYGLFSDRYLSEESAPGYRTEIAPDQWISDEVPKKLLQKLGSLKYTRSPVFKYSDVNYVLLQQIVERAVDQPLDEYVREQFYEPMGLGRLVFRPAQQFSWVHTVPTAVDKWMRRELVRGYVHDEGAALLGGVAGHAGLFGNAADLATLFQMLLNEGELNGRQFLAPETVRLFTAKSRFNYRALGFDRLMGGWKSLKQLGAGESTFGHTGFSGTSVWADPEQDIVVVLLTNRIHPDPKNDRLTKMKLRGKVHRRIYQALMEA